MRILSVMASGARGGGAEHLLGLLPALRERGHEVGAWVGDDGPLPGELAGHGIAARPIRLMHSRLDPVALYRLRRDLARHAPDVVHWHGTRAAFYGAFSRAPSVYTAHGLAQRKERTPWRRALFSAAEALACRADQVISVSRTDRDELVRRGFVSADRAHYVPNAVRPERFADRPSRRDARAALGLESRRSIFGTTSRLVEQKGLDIALRAASRLGEATFVVAGDGPLEGELRGLADSLGVDVRWLGRRDDVATVLAALDVFFLSSRWEGEPISLLEAMHCGLPCVATATEGARELLGGGAGWLTPIDDPAALARAMRDAATRGAPEEARARAMERSFATMAERVESILAEACRGFGGRR